MWALGISLLEIVAGKHPFANMTSWQTLTAIRTWTANIPANPKISNDMKELITQLYVSLSLLDISLFLKIFLSLQIEEKCR